MTLWVGRLPRRIDGILPLLPSQEFEEQSRLVGLAERRLVALCGLPGRRSYRCELRRRYLLGFSDLMLAPPGLTGDRSCRRARSQE
jgi:hypothetical protein